SPPPCGTVIELSSCAGEACEFTARRDDQESPLTGLAPVAPPPPPAALAGLAAFSVLTCCCSDDVCGATASFAALVMLGFNRKNHKIASTSSSAARPMTAGSSQGGINPSCCIEPSTMMVGSPSWWTLTLYGASFGGPVRKRVRGLIRIEAKLAVPGSAVSAGGVIVKFSFRSGSAAVSLALMRMLP